MRRNKKFIDDIIRGRTNFNFRVRTIADKEDEFSKLIPYEKSSENFLYNSKIIDGINLVFKNATIKVNARHKFY